jgi:hypothetical protein
LWSSLGNIHFVAKQYVKFLFVNVLFGYGADISIPGFGLWPLAQELLYAAKVELIISLLTDPSTNKILKVACNNNTQLMPQLYNVSQLVPCFWTFFQFPSYQVAPCLFMPCHSRGLIIYHIGTTFSLYLPLNNRHLSNNVHHLTQDLLP